MALYDKGDDGRILWGWAIICVPERIDDKVETELTRTNIEHVRRWIPGGSSFAVEANHAAALNSVIHSVENGWTSKGSG